MTAPLLQYLDVVGDGSGSKTGAVNGSATPVELSIAPASGIEYRLSYLTMTIEDNAALLGDTFGSSALTNGLRIRVLDEDDVVLREIDAGVAIKRIADLTRLGASVALDASGTNKFASYRLSFSQPIVLSGARGARLAVTISDDLSNLVLLSFLAEGWSRGAIVA